MPPHAPRDERGTPPPATPPSAGASGTEGETQQPRIARWARLVVNVRIPLRRGAWYPVLSAGPEEVVVEVRQRPTIVPRAVVDISTVPPSRWTLVPQSWGGPYYVCPECSERMRARVPIVPRREMPLSCIRCHKTFPTDLTDLAALQAELPGSQTSETENPA